MDLRKGLELLIFDFDGTLFDLGDFNTQVLRKKLTENPDEKLGDIMQRLRKLDSPLLQHVTDAEVAAVGERRIDEPIIDTLLGLAKHHHLAVLTRNSRRAIELAIKGTRLENSLYIVGREDTVNQKPHPEGIKAILSHFKVAADKAALVGDTYHDVGAAKAAGLKSVIVHNHRLDYQPEGADHYITTIPELTPARLLNQVAGVTQLTPRQEPTSE